MKTQDIPVSLAIEKIVELEDYEVKASPAAKAFRELAKHFIMIGCQYDWDEEQVSKE